MTQSGPGLNSLVQRWERVRIGTDRTVVVVVPQHVTGGTIANQNVFLSVCVRHKCVRACDRRACVRVRACVRACACDIIITCLMRPPILDVLQLCESPCSAVDLGEGGSGGGTDLMQTTCTKQVAGSQQLLGGGDGTSHRRVTHAQPHRTAPRRTAGRESPTMS